MAIKVLPDEFAQDQERLRRFKREAKVLASLNHPGIAAIHGLEESEGTHYLVLELVPGETLAERISRGPIPVDEAVEIATKIAEALEEAHEQGIVHRDLKPANIMQTEDGEIKVLDFGLAKALVDEATDADSSMSPTLTRDATRVGVILGTAAYMSPEQAKAKPVDKRADIFAFGAVLYEMLTGKKAFPGADVSEVLASVIKLEPDWNHLPAETRSSIRQLLRRCLEKDPKERLRDIGDARFELADRESGEAANVATTPSRGHRLPWAVAAMATLALAAALMFGSAEDTEVLYTDVAPPPGASFRLGAGAPGPPALSPDGSMVTFSAREADGSVRLYVRSLVEAEPRRLPGTDGATYPFWSPDSRRIGFFAAGKLKKVEALGSPPENICDAVLGKGGTWNEAGDIVFSPGPGAPLYRVSQDGGEPAVLTELDREQSNSHRFPQFLPNGREFLFLARSAVAGQQHSVMTGSLDGGEPQRLLRSTGDAQYASGYLLYLRERTVVAQRFDPEQLTLSGEAMVVAENVRIVSASTGFGVFSASRNGRLVYLMGRDDSRLHWLDRTGRSLGFLEGDEDYLHVTLSPDGKRAAVGIFDEATGSSDLWVVDLERGVRSRLTSDSFYEGPARWSPSGDTVVFNSTPMGHFDVFETRVDNPGETNLLLDLDASASLSSWSRDGELVILETESDIWLLPMNPKGEPYPFFETSFNEGRAALSPNSRWMAYVSNESGREEIYVTPFPDPRNRVLVSTNGGNIPWWRDDGRELLYREPSGQVVAVTVDGRGEVFVVGKSEPLFRAELGFPTYAPTPDAQRFLIIRPVDDNPRSLTLVQNWTAALQN